MNPAIITLIILVAAAILFITEKLPVPLTAMLCLAALVLTGIVTPTEAIAGFSNSTVILLVSMVLVGGTFGPFSIGKIGLPLTIITFVWLLFYGYKILPDRKPADDNSIFAETGKKEAPLWKQVASVLIIAGVFLGMCFSDAIGFPFYMISMLAAILVCALGILKGKQVYNMIDMKTVFLYVGMLPLGEALQTTGAAQMIADVADMICGGSGNVYLITAVVFIVSCFMTQFTSNVVTINLLVPIVIAIGNTLGVSPAALIVTATIAATHGYVSPVSCPPATIIYGNGGFKFKDYGLCNWSLLLLSFIACVVLLPMMWPLS